MWFADSEFKCLHICMVSWLVLLCSEEWHREMARPCSCPVDLISDSSLARGVCSGSVISPFLPRTRHTPLGWPLPVPLSPSLHIPFLLERGKKKLFNWIPLEFACLFPSLLRLLAGTSKLDYLIHNMNIEIAGGSRLRFGSLQVLIKDSLTLSLLLLDDIKKRNKKKKIRFWWILIWMKKKYIIYSF